MPAYIESKGACIYCGAINVPLSNEHVVPFAIGGQLVIRKASCKKCADITKKFEQRVMRDLWGDARIAFDAPSRRKSKRKNKLVVPTQGVVVPADKYPAGFAFYKMCEAGMLQGIAPDVDISGKWQIVIIDDDKSRENFLKEYLSKKQAIAFQHVPLDFGRLLAKIGYGQILGSLDPSDFDPVCVPYILGQKTNISYIVGGNPEAQKPDPKAGYRLGTFGYITKEKLALLASVRLLANTHAPACYVVIGNVAGARQISKVMEKLKKHIVHARVSRGLSGIEVYHQIIADEDGCRRQGG